jgi:hypothetical protein
LQYARLVPIRSKKLAIEDLDESSILHNFRFKSRQQLIRLRDAFKFVPRRVDGKVFTGDEILLAGLFRLHAPNVLGDVGWTELFGFDQPRASAAVNLFLAHLKQWYFLLHLRLIDWRPHFPMFWRAIKAKIDSWHHHHHAETAFFPMIFGFIDNVQVETCRPDGPTVDGGRTDPLLQQAFYNGWKHNLGVKLQTIDLPDGLNYHAFGPVSLRHSDLFTLSESHMDARIRAVQAGGDVQFKVYGDSAYKVGTYTHILAQVPVPEHQVQVDRALSASASNGTMESCFSSGLCWTTTKS